MRYFKYTFYFFIFLSSDFAWAEDQYSCQELQLDDSADFEQQVIKDSEVLKLNVVSAKNLAEAYAEKRKKMNIQNNSPITFFTIVKPETVNSDMGSEQDKIKNAVETIEYFVKNSAKDNPGIKTDYRKDQIHCRVKSRYLLSNRAVNIECVARICLTAVPYKKANASSSAASK